MQACQFGSGFGESAKVRDKRNARQLPFQIGSILFTVLRVIQNAVDVVEDVTFGDVIILVVRSKLL